MSKLISLVSVVVLLSVLVLVSFVFWYFGSSSPLTAQEVDNYVQSIEANQTLSEEPFDKVGLQQFLEQDDGEPFFMVNVIRFRERAKYRDGRESALTGAEAANLFNAAVIPLLVKRGSHPIFGGSGIHSIYDSWDLVGVVRYRSRRDLADLFASKAFAEASVHRNAGIERRIHFPIKGVDLPSLILILFVFFMLVVIIVRYLLRWKNGKAGFSIETEDVN